MLKHIPEDILQGLPFLFPFSNKTLITPVTYLSWLRRSVQKAVDISELEADRFVALTADLLDKRIAGKCHDCGWSTVLTKTWKRGWLCAECLSEPKRSF